MTTSTIAIIVIGGLLLFFILMKVGKFLFKGVAILAAGVILYFLVFNGKGDFGAMLDKQNIFELNDRFCTEAKKERTICQCFVNPVYQQLLSDHSAAELQRMKASPENLKAATKKSFAEVRSGMDDCLKAKGKDKVATLQAMKEKLDNLIPATEE